MPSLFPSFRFGGDYNPEQWPEDVWDDDVRLMVGAHVTTATVGVFSWARMEPRPGEYDFAWLDRVLDRLHAAGIRVIMATGTASPPAWMARQFPDTLPVDEHGIRLGFGSRQQYSPSSATFRERAASLVRAVAAHYAGHPAIEAWHVGNEYGCHVAHSYDDESVAAFRAWLTDRYGTIAELNRAWGTDFWSQRYGSFDEVDAPRIAPSYRNPTHLLDWERFSSHQLLGLFRMERDLLRELAPGIPITTNFMGFFRSADYWTWAPEVDFVSDDCYPDPADPATYVKAAASRDLMRSLGGGAPWLLMEQSPSAVNWRERNAPKPEGMNRIHSLQAIGRGSDGALHFQWRQAAAGAEKFHAGMVPHAGPDTRVHRGIQALGAELAELSQREVLGQPVLAQAAIVFDWESWWAIEQLATPARIDYVESVLEWHAGLLRRGVTVDFVRPGAPLDGYPLVVVPLLHTATGNELALFAAHAESGAQVVVTYQTGVLDRDLHAHLGGYLGGADSALQRALGVRVEEQAPLPDAHTAADITGDFAVRARSWQEFIVVSDAEVLGCFASGPAAGSPALTRRATRNGGGAWYVATQPTAEGMDALYAEALTAAGIAPDFAEPVFGLETVVRGRVRFVLNHTPAEVTALVAGERVTVPAYGAVLREA